MQYQLPNGKVIHLSVEEYLSLSDQDIQDLVALNLGDYATSPWEGSAIKKHKKPKEQQDIDRGIDFKEDSDEVEPSVTIQGTIMTVITVDEITSPDSGDDISEEIEDT